ncbi:MAG: hypothetical protein D6732_18460 [Methanobacteriota archaeon]|nr:MAG: hypothetical protein D6732_18460 [Euryarchaeota archaeon]
MREQAREHLTSYPHIHITGDLNSLLAQHFDIIFCLEVFEHLPPEVRRENLMILSNLVKREGMVVLGIPNEIFIPALLKGVLRMARRYGEDDARLGNVLRAFMGIPPRERPVVSFDGLPYILRHMGFDYREFIKEVNDVFRIMDRYGSPFPALPLLLNFEIYLKCVLPQD